MKKWPSKTCFKYINPPVKDTTISEQFPNCNSPPSLPAKLCIYTFSKADANTYESENWIFVFFPLSCERTPMNNNRLLAMKFSFNLQINKNMTFNRAADTDTFPNSQGCPLTIELMEFLLESLLSL